MEALRSGDIDRVLVAETVERAFRDALASEAGQAGVTVETVSRERIEATVSEGNTQGVAASVRQVRLRKPSDLIASGGAIPLLLVLEEIQDPRNLGSLLRSAEAAGCHGVIVTERRTAPLTGIVSKASSGALHHLSMAAAASMSHLLAELRDRGVWTVGLAGQARQTIYDVDLTVPTALLVGGEGGGLRRLTAERVDTLASIPMRGRIDSLNASVAGAIALFEAVRQRLRGG